MNRQEYESQARAIHDASMERVRSKPYPPNQKFPPGTRVKIADDLGSHMRHFPKGRLATVICTYAHAFGGDNVQDYCLDVDGYGRSSWYYEHQLTLVEDEWPDTIDS